MDGWCYKMGGFEWIKNNFPFNEDFIKDLNN